MVEKREKMMVSQMGENTVVLKGLTLVEH
jgi:hypothetical protein